MKKIICTLILTVILSQSSFEVLAMNPNEQAEMNISVEQENGGDQQLFGKKKSKTITKNYTSLSSIPASVYYEEYTDNSWWGGDLKWTGETEVLYGGIYKATFKGKLKKLNRT